MNLRILDVKTTIIDDIHMAELEAMGDITRPPKL